MESVLRAVAVYAILVLLFRITGKRSLAQVTTFDLVLLLVISEAIQNGLVANDDSLTNSVLLVVTLAGIDIGLSVVKYRWPRVEALLDGVSIVLVADGRPVREHMEKERVDREDILHAARQLHGLERLDQIKYAVLERSGGISIIPKQG